MKKIDLTIEKVEVELNGEVFVINPDVPIQTMKRLTKMQETIGEDYEQRSNFIVDSLKEYLYIENDHEKVDSFVSTLGSIQALKLYKFISSTIVEEQNKEITEEKKTE